MALTGIAVLPTHHHTAGKQTNYLSSLLPSRPFVKLCKKYLLLLVVTVIVSLSIFSIFYLPVFDSIATKLNKRNIDLYFNRVYGKERTTNTSAVTGSDSNININNNNVVTDVSEKNILSDSDRVNDRVESEEREIIRESPVIISSLLPEISSTSKSSVLPKWSPLALPSGEDPDPEVVKKRDYVKRMMRDAWDSYKKYAWGENELRPISKRGHTADIFGANTKLGATIVDAMDTLWIMNMTEEFNLGRDWIDKNLSLDNVNSYLSVFETVIRFVGGLLSCYAFTNDYMFVEKAKHVAEKMLPAFNTETGIPKSLVNPNSGQIKQFGWTANSILSEIGSLHLEFVYLSDVTLDDRFKQKVIRVRQILDALQKPHNGLYPLYLNAQTGNFVDDQISIGALGDSFYEYLIKSWIQSNGTDTRARKMYDEAVTGIESELVHVSANSSLVYLANLNYGRLEHKMQHLTCFAGGMFAIGGQSLADSERRKHYIKLGADITETCHQSYARTATKIGPEEFYFNDKAEATSLNQKYYILRPEVIESYFYMWRVTHEQKYRDYAWSAAQAIEHYCRTDAGYSGISNVDDVHTGKDDVQQSFFLAETLKYLYLIFSSDELISLDQWVFNTEAHPLPIFANNPAYPPLIDNRI